MKKLFKFFILLNAMISILAVCPDRPVIPTSSITNGLLITPSSEGMSNFPTSTTHLSVTMTVAPDQECTAGSTFNLLAIGLTPPGSSTQEYLTVSINCDPLQLLWGGDWYNPTPINAFSSGFSPFSFFLTLDLEAKFIWWQYQSASKSGSTLRRDLTIIDGMSFDENTKFYLCSDKLGVSPNACTISEFVLEYRAYGSRNGNPEYAHLDGKNPSLAAFYPLIDGSLKSYANSEIQAASGYFGDHPTNPTPGTSPIWDSSNAFVTLTPGQFLTFPLPSIVYDHSTTSYSFAVAVWVKIRDIPMTPATNTPIISTHLADGTLSGYSVTVTGVTETISISFNTLLAGNSGVVLRVVLGTWQLIGFTAYVRTDTKYSEGNVFCGTSSKIFYQLPTAPPFDFSTLSFIRIGSETNSFGGDISLVRIMTPGGGILRNTDLCSSLSSFELGAGNFAMSCSTTNRLSSADGKCYELCPSGTRSAVAETALLCLPCSTHCAACDSTQCLACNANYYLSEGVCLDSCPDKTYSTGSTCEKCSANCLKCDSTECLACEANHFFYQGSCLDSCPKKTYSKDSTCQDCQTNCQYCNSAECLTCETNYLLYKGNCRGFCPEKTYSTGSACQGCPANCKTCDDLQCLACLTNHVLYQGGCLNSCPDQTYSTGSECQNCQSHCKTCGQAGCLTCETNYFFYQEDCLDSCPAETYAHQDSCIACSDHCIVCEIDECKACDDGYQLNSEQKCVLPPSPAQVEAGISGGAIAGIVCGGIALTIVAGWVFYIIKLKKSLLFRQRSKANFKLFNSNPPSATRVITPIQTCETEMGPMIP